MSQPKVDVLIIGNGFAGIVAANRLAAAGAGVVLLDENIHIGGQLLRRLPEQLGSPRSYHPDYVKKIGLNFIAALKSEKITILNRSRVLGIYPGREVLIEENENTVRTLKAERIILATGAREKFLPFRGWTMPGVLSSGAVQVLIKGSGVLPARDLLIGGSGVFLYSVAYECLKAGARVQAVLEQSRMLDKGPLAWQLLHQLPKLSEGARFMSKLILSRVPLRFNTRIIEARGSGTLAAGRQRPGRRLRQDENRQGKNHTARRCWPSVTASAPTSSWRRWPAAGASMRPSGAAGWSAPTTGWKHRCPGYSPPERSPASPAP